MFAHVVGSPEFYWAIVAELSLLVWTALLLVAPHLSGSHDDRRRFRVSGRSIADALRERGHDVRAADEERDLDGCEDERLLELATADVRIMVTFNVKDFARIVSEWAAAGTSHAGCLMIVGIDHGEFGLFPRVIGAAVEARSEQGAWSDYAAWGTRKSGT